MTFLEEAIINSFFWLSTKLQLKALYGKKEDWIPAFAGMTLFFKAIYSLLSFPRKRESRKFI
jgi:hypothetical protein